MSETLDLKREMLRHLVATLAYRGRVAVLNAPEDFADFRLSETTRTPAELLAHIGDNLQGSLYLMQGEMVYLNSLPLSWEEEIARFFINIKEFDAYLASDAPLAQPVEKIMQGPIADALTHVGQIVMMRRLAGAPVQADSYFNAQIIAGKIHEKYFVRN
jgi:hypothetical protein